MHHFAIALGKLMLSWEIRKDWMTYPSAKDVYVTPLIPICVPQGPTSAIVLSFVAISPGPKLN